MKSNQEILDEFGQTFIHNVFDNGYRFVNNRIEDLAQTEGYQNLFGNMSAAQKKEFDNYTAALLEGALFDFLRIFEENIQFKLLYDDGSTQADLDKISEMLKAEPIIQNGWIKRFSRERLP